MIGTTAFSFLACVVLRIAPCKASVSPYFFFTRILGTAFCTALSFQAGNTAYLYLSGACNLAAAAAAAAAAAGGGATAAAAAAAAAGATAAAAAVTAATIAAAAHAAIT
jgi:hypothetical protein